MAMFKIIGGDQQEYGPVSTDELRDWIRSGRAGRDTLVRREGETEWKPLSALPEFAEAFGTLGGTGPIAAIPDSRRPVDPNTLADAVRAKNEQVDIGAAFGRAWQTLVSDFWPIVGVSALVLIATVVANGAIIGPLITGPLMGGLFGYYLGKVRRQPATLAVAFSGFSRAFFQLVLCALIAGFLVGVGLALCLIPGIYLMVAWTFALPLIWDRRFQFWDAMEVSRKVINQRWWGFFGVVFLSALINVGGLLALGVGLFVTFPWTMLALAWLYEDRFGNVPRETAST
jgi:hypothetical protein